MNIHDDTTISNHYEDEKDELLLLTGLERLQYFSAKPELKKKTLKEQLTHFFKKISI